MDRPSSVDRDQEGRAGLPRDEKNKIVWISPGLLFPIMGAMSAFVGKTSKGEWRIEA
ncbi:MAG: hypothetical protein M3R58_17275 [Pseudomonadota bacterium]|nr:hypothetical protein [Pseudomonadota bacterium]